MCGRSVPFPYTPGENQAVRVQPECSQPQLTHHMCAPKASWKHLVERDWKQGQYNCFGSQIFQSAGTAAAQHFQSCSPLHWYQGDYNPLPFCPSFTFFPFHVRHDKEMRNHSLCYASAVSFMSGHCTSKDTQYLRISVHSSFPGALHFHGLYF